MAGADERDGGEKLHKIRIPEGAEVVYATKGIPNVLLVVGDFEKVVAMRGTVSWNVRRGR